MDTAAIATTLEWARYNHSDQLVRDLAAAWLDAGGDDVRRMERVAQLAGDLIDSRGCEYCEDM